MTDKALSEHQREILGWLADRWELIRWYRPRRWHMGEMAVDGRAVRGLLRRGLVELGGTYAGGELVLTAAGRQAITCSDCGHQTSDHRPGVGCDDIGVWDGHGWTGCACNREEFR